MILFWSRIVRSLRRSSSATPSALGDSSQLNGDPPSSDLYFVVVSVTKTLTSCFPGSRVGSVIENPALGFDAGRRPQMRPIVASPRTKPARVVLTRKPSMYTTTADGFRASVSHPQPCTTPRDMPSTWPASCGVSSFWSPSVESSTFLAPIVAAASSTSRGKFPRFIPPRDTRAPPSSASFKSSTSALRMLLPTSMRLATYNEHRSENATMSKVCVF
mmetsp:Transcript_14211/g.47109  ORF Transcript_14211/g.47109 Transcript_14211/m.47109 type:complete len:217 (+) Transcript_14211:1551-2201(+)